MPVKWGWATPRPVRHGSSTTPGAVVGHRPSSSSNGSSPRPQARPTAHPGDVGMQALGFDVPDVGDAVRAATDQGARCAREDQPVSAPYPDTDGVALELSAAPVESSLLRYARIVCSDLERSARWYGLLGFVPIGSEETIRRDHNGAATEVVDSDCRSPDQRRSISGSPHGPHTSDGRTRRHDMACSAWRSPCRTCAPRSRRRGGRAPSRPATHRSFLCLALRSVASGILLQRS